MQMIMQDPISSLNPRRKVKDLVAEGLAIWGFDPRCTTARTRRPCVRELLEAVGLEPDVVWDRRPHELSGGQCQRVCIARALMMRPRVMICDEPVSSLDVSVQAQILNLLEETKERFALSMVFIAHDVSVVKNISDRVMVLYLGKACEVVPSDDMHLTSVHPYTRMLLASIPGAETEAEPETSPVLGTSVESHRAAPRRSTRRPAAASAPGARSRPSCAPRRSRCCARSRRGTSSPVTTCRRARATRPPRRDLAGVSMRTGSTPTALAAAVRRGDLSPAGIGHDRHRPDRAP